MVVDPVLGILMYTMFGFASIASSVGNEPPLKHSRSGLYLTPNLTSVASPSEEEEEKEEDDDPITFPRERRDAADEEEEEEEDNDDDKNGEEEEDE